jgi:hypothetical protein
MGNAIIGFTGIMEKREEFDSNSRPFFGVKLPISKISEYFKIKKETIEDLKQDNIDVAFDDLEDIAHDVFDFILFPDFKGGIVGIDIDGNTPFNVLNDVNAALKKEFGKEGWIYPVTAEWTHN